MTKDINAAAETAEDTSAAVLTGSSSGPGGRPSWSGLLRLSLVAIPIKAYPAVNRAAAIEFNQLHARCGRRIQYHKHCPVHGQVEATDIVRGFCYAPDHYLEIESDELDKLRPLKDKALDLEQFIPGHEVDPVQYAGRSLYLLPDGLAAQRAYGVVAQALEQSRKWAIGRVVLTGNRQLVLVRAVVGMLVMDLLRFPEEVRPAPAGEGAGRSPAAISATPEEQQLARTLIDAASRPLDWTQYRDTTAEELRALIEAKLSGRPVLVPTEEPLAVLQLLDALKQSVYCRCKVSHRHSGGCGGTRCRLATFSSQLAGRLCQ